jgi:hypothetical protein
MKQKKRKENKEGTQGLEPWVLLETGAVSRGLLSFPARTPATLIPCFALLSLVSFVLCGLVQYLHLFCYFVYYTTPRVFGHFTYPAAPGSHATPCDAFRLFVLLLIFLFNFDL